MSQKRVVLNVSVIPKTQSYSEKEAILTYSTLNNSLTASQAFPNVNEIPSYCESFNKKLGAYIYNTCNDLDKYSSLFSPEKQKSNRILSILDAKKCKDVRVIIYPGPKEDIDDLNMISTTHTMIVDFEESLPNFNVTRPHRKCPSFYQPCNSEKTALLYFESLLVDACLCHYLSVSEAAAFHDEKQKISKEKVDFIREITKEKKWGNLSKGAQELIRFVVNKLDDNTPYISFFSIFTIAPLDFFTNGEYNDSNRLAYFNDFCVLWKLFQEWYFNKHNKLLYVNEEVDNPLASILHRNKYLGQIGKNSFENKINKIMNNIKNKKNLYDTEEPFGTENRYAVVVLEHTPPNKKQYLEFEPLISGDVHQGAWNIVYWNKLHLYVEKDFSIIPFIIKYNNFEEE